jgi:hypothetical protein
VLSHDDVVADRSFSNLSEVDTVLASELAAYDVLRSDWVVFTDRTLPRAAGDEPAGDDAVTDGEVDADA